MARRGPDAGNGRRIADSALMKAAEAMVNQIGGLVTDIIALRAENDELRGEVQHAIEMLERASAALGNQRPRKQGGAGPAAPRPGPRRSKRPKGRATPAAVTSDVVRAAVAKLGTATASEIAEAITTAGAPVSGRAVRFIAERAGATTTVGPDGKRRYRFG